MDEHSDFQLFRYDPSLAAAVIFVILFLAMSLLHTYQIVVSRTWFFTAFVVGGYRKSTMPDDMIRRGVANKHQ